MIPGHPRSSSRTGSRVSTNSQPTGRTIELTAGRQHPRSVPFTLKRSQRRTIGFRIDATGLTVTAPSFVPETEIHRALHTKASWILAKLQEWQSRLDNPQQTASGPLMAGSVLRLFGQPVVLHVQASVARSARLELQSQPDAIPVLLAPPPTPDAPPPPPAAVTDAHAPFRKQLRLPLTEPAVRSMSDLEDHVLAQPQDASSESQSTMRWSLRLEAPIERLAQPDWIDRKVHEWMGQQALAHFVHRVQHFSDRLGRWPRSVGLTRARSRWGSCSSEGRILLSWRLIHLPPDVIDYVVAHEVAHLAEMNHSPRFWATVEQLMPEYRRARNILRQCPPA